MISPDFYKFLSYSAECLDRYTKLRVAGAATPGSGDSNGSAADSHTIDPRLEAIVDRMFQRCLDDKQYKQAIGIALETHRIDVFERAILQSVSTCLP